MHRTRIKICGLTIPAQAEAIAQLGVDAIGLVFAPSKRQVSLDQAQAITKVLPPGLAVGVFVDATADEINAIADQAPLAAIQLHGHESPEIVTQLNRPCVKVFAIRDAESFVAIQQWVREAKQLAAASDKPRPGGLVGVLLDAYDPKLAGGTGRTFDWQLLLDAREKGLLDDLPPMMLSAGLTPENVAEAISLAQPWGVDVSSGVETAPGVKDLEKAQAFIEAVHNAD